MQIQLTTSQWLALPAEIKAKLKQTFNIPRSGGSRIEDNRVMSDGHEHRDLAVITTAAMQTYLALDLNPEQEFYGLFDAVLDKIHADTKNEVTEGGADQTAPVPEIVFSFGDKLYRAVEIGAAPANATVQPLYPTAPQEAANKLAAVKPKVTRAPRKKAKK